MSVFESRRPIPLGAITTHRVVSAVERTLSDWRRWRQARETHLALSRLSDRELDDIGLTRGSIVEVSDRLARG